MERRELLISARAALKMQVDDKSIWANWDFVVSICTPPNSCMQVLQVLLPVVVVMVGRRSTTFPVSVTVFNLVIHEI